MDTTLLLLLISIITVESFAQWCLQKTLKKKDHLFLIGGVMLYSVVGIIYYHILKHGKKLAIANTLWNAGSEISIAIMGYLFFKQDLRKEQIFGIVLILIAMNLV